MASIQSVSRPSEINLLNVLLLQRRDALLNRVTTQRPLTAPAFKPVTSANNGVQPAVQQVDSTNRAAFATRIRAQLLQNLESKLTLNLYAAYTANAVSANVPANPSTSGIVSTEVPSDVDVPGSASAALFLQNLMAERQRTAVSNAPTSPDNPMEAPPGNTPNTPVVPNLTAELTQPNATQSTVQNPLPPAAPISLRPTTSNLTPTISTAPTAAEAQALLLQATRSAAVTAANKLVTSNPAYATLVASLYVRPMVESLPSSAIDLGFPPDTAVPPVTPVTRIDPVEALPVGGTANAFRRW